MFIVIQREPKHNKGNSFANIANAVSVFPLKDWLFQDMGVKAGADPWTRKGGHTAKRREGTLWKGGAQ